MHDHELGRQDGQGNSALRCQWYISGVWGHCDVSGISVVCGGTVMSVVYQWCVGRVEEEKVRRGRGAGEGRRRGEEKICG